jgi:hypothetical protein
MGSTCGLLARAALLALLALLLTGGPFAAARRADSAEPTAAPAATVRLIIDYGDGVQKHFTQLAWRDGMTVWDALQAASKHPRGITVRHRGSGETTLITQIDERKNGGDEQRNWIYRVNDKTGQRSAAICPVESGDTILWSFETYR